MSSIPIPAKAPLGPFFIDTASCQCALQLFNQSAVHVGDKAAEEAWRCIGNANGDAYTGENGKWYLPTDPVEYAGAGSRNDINQPMDWGGNPPDLDKTYIVDNKTHDLEPLNDADAAQLSIVDTECTGQNSSEQSSQYYNDVYQVKAGHPATGATICLAGTTPVELQNETVWVNDGCNLGFLCMSPLNQNENHQGQ